MEDIFKKFIYDGVGWISETSEKFKKTIDGFIKEGKLKADEGKKIVDEFVKNSDSKKEELENEFNSIIGKIVDSLKFAKSEELKNLEKRVSELETTLKKSNKTKDKKVKSKKSENKSSKKATPKKK